MIFLCSLESIISQKCIYLLWSFGIGNIYIYLLEPRTARKFGALVQSRDITTLFKWPSLWTPSHYQLQLLRNRWICENVEEFYMKFIGPSFKCSHDLLRLRFILQVFWPVFYETSQVWPGLWIDIQVQFTSQGCQKAHIFFWYSPNV